MLLQEELGKLSHSGINEIGKNISGKLAERKKLWMNGSLWCDVAKALKSSQPVKERWSFTRRVGGAGDHLMKWEQPKKFWMSHFNSICSLINYHCSEYQLFVSVAQGTGLRRWQLSWLVFSKHCFQEKLGEYWMPYPIWRTLAEKIWCKSLDCAPLQCFSVASVGPQGPQRVQINDGKIQKSLQDWLSVLLDSKQPKELV